MFYGSIEFYFKSKFAQNGSLDSRLLTLHMTYKAHVIYKLYDCCIVYINHWFCLGLHERISAVIRKELGYTLYRLPVHHSLFTSEFKQQVCLK